MASAFVWAIFLMGLAIIGSCFFYPREIGKEDQKLVDVKVDMQRLEDMALRVRLATDRRLAERKARIAERRANIAQRRAEAQDRAAQAAGVPLPTPIRPAPQAPPAMGATQPVLGEDPAAALTIANGAENPFGVPAGTFDGSESGFL